MADLDVKDRKILQILDMDARQTYSQIAKRVGLSKEVVNYRLKNLENKGIVNGYYAILDVAKLGFAPYRIIIKYRDISEEKKKKLMEYAKKHPSFAWVASLEGTWNSVFVIWSKSIYDFKKIYDDFMFNFGELIQEKEVTVATSIIHFKKNYLYTSKDFTSLIVGGDRELEKIDEKDYKILLQLSQNARSSILTIAKKSDLTPNAAKYRIKNLEKKGIILGYRAMVDTKKLGYQHFKVFLNFYNVTEEEKKRLIEYLKHDSNVIYVTDPVGRADLEFESELDNATKLYEFIKEMKVEFPNFVRDYEVILTYQEHRINYLPPN
ncbi:AsnC family transcriptional regulator [Candidatus Woesearchaeota archaeon]|jgi:DNA-binding Lrp family transcriptional regulator|nr:AsnC family transcriptional regulator [Candidatus Woesearchaeota archaeon]